MQDPGRLLLWISIFMGGACIAGAQETRVLFSVIGQVLEPDGRPAAGAAVTISSQGGFTAQALADDMGRFEIPNLARGRYRLTASKPPLSEKLVIW